MNTSPVASVPPRHKTDILEMPFGNSPAVSLQVRHLDAFDAGKPGPAELSLVFQMLDALLLTTPFDQWEN